MALQDAKEKMTKTLERVKENFSGFRTGRANPAILNKIHVDYYGSMVPLQQVAGITVPENNLLVLNVFDRGAVVHVERAISSSDLNLTPQTDGNIIRLRLPELTEQRRKDLVKNVKTEAEEGRVSVRNIRRDALDALKASEKNGDVSEDELKKQQEEIQKVTDSYIAQIDQLAKAKEAEIMKI
jgi:ribosome recycling factor